MSDASVLLVRARRKYLGRASLAGWFAIASVLTSPLLEAMPGTRGMGWLALVAAVVSTFLWFVFRTFESTLDGTLAVESDAIRITNSEGEAQHVPFASIVRARMTPAGEGRKIEWTLRNNDVLEMDFERASDADALFAAAGLDARHQRYEASLGLRSNRFLGGFVTFIGSAIGLGYVLSPMVDSLPAHWFPFYLLTCLGGGTLATAGLLALFRPPHVTVGAEGLDLRVSIWRHALPYRDLVNVRLADDHLLVFTYRNGRKSTLYASVPRAESEALILRIEDAQRVYASRDASTDTVVLDRSGRSTEAWRSALRALLTGTRSYRDAHLDRDSLVRVLEDPDAPAERRIGAALALREQGGEPVERIRAVAQVCASEPLRVALERAAETTLDDATIDAAVAHERTRQPL